MKPNFLITHAVVWHLFVWISAAGGETGDRARAVLEKASKALESVSSFSYGFHYFGDGSLQGHFTGKVWGQGENPANSSYHVQMEGYREKPMDETDSWWITSHQNRADFVDFREKTHAFGHVDKGNSHLLTNMYYAVWFQFTTPNPFAGELNSGKLSTLPGRFIAGIACVGVRIELPDSPFGDLEHWWYFGREDHLPRAQIWKNRSKGQEGVFRFDIRDLRVNLDIPRARFLPPTLPDFQKIDEDARALVVGAVAPNWALKALDGTTVSLDQFRGKLVVLDFWASWCPPCQRLMPAMEKLAEDFAGKVAVLGINTWESQETDLRRYLKRHKISYPILTNGETIAQAYKVGSIPAMYAIDDEGRFLFIGDFLRDPNPIPKLRAALEKALAEKP